MSEFHIVNVRVSVIVEQDAFTEKEIERAISEGDSPWMVNEILGSNPMTREEANAFVANRGGEPCYFGS